MTRSPRIVMVLAVAICVLSALGVESEPPAEKETDKAAVPWTLASDAHSTARLQEAAGRIHKKDWDGVLDLLQQLLDAKSNALALLTEKDGKTKRYVSVHAEAERMLASLPATTRELYQFTYGPRASAVDRYLYTDAGRPDKASPPGIRIIYHSSPPCNRNSLKFSSSTLRQGG